MPGHATDRHGGYTVRYVHSAGAGLGWWVATTTNWRAANTKHGSDVPRQATPTTSEPTVHVEAVRALTMAKCLSRYYLMKKAGVARKGSGGVGHQFATFTVSPEKPADRGYTCPGVYDACPRFVWGRSMIRT
jgi:hypothetical protein